MVESTRWIMPILKIHVQVESSPPLLISILFSLLLHHIIHELLPFLKTKSNNLYPCLLPRVMRKQHLEGYVQLAFLQRL